MGRLTIGDCGEGECVDRDVCVEECVGERGDIGEPLSEGFNDNGRLLRLVGDVMDDANNDGDSGDDLVLMSFISSVLGIAVEDDNDIDKGVVEVEEEDCDGTEEKEEEESDNDEDVSITASCLRRDTTSCIASFNNSSEEGNENHSKNASFIS